MDKLICFALGLITGTSICVALTNNARPTAFPRYSNKLDEQDDEEQDNTSSQTVTDGEDKTKS